MQLAVSHQNVDDLMEEIVGMTAQYKEMAKEVTKLLIACENERTRILNTIDEARHNGISIRTAWHLEDKLSRPYSMILCKL
jgi:hypothetical protein